MPDDREACTRLEPRAPALAAAFALAGGIVLDRYGQPSFAVWMGCAASLLAAAGAVLWWGRSTDDRRRAALVSTIGVLAWWVCVGGMRHHTGWQLRAADNVSTCLSETRQPVRLTARLLSPLVIDAADRSSARPAWTRMDRTVGVLACRSLGPVGRETTVSGCVRLVVTGHLLGPRAGDTLELWGQLAQPAGQRNPGGFDYANYLRSQGVDAVLLVEHPDHVRVVASQYNWRDRLSQWRDGLRREAEALFIERLDSRYVPLATSLLLGDRTGIEQELADAFAASGTLHLLAISGLNVGIMAGLMQLVCRLLQTGPRATTLILLLTVLGYAAITDQRPPVMRAALLAVIVLAGRAGGREAGGYQSLALCALAVLLYQPTDLFDAGAQLSFVAVWAILWSGRWLAQGELDRLSAQDAASVHGPVWSRLAPLRQALWQAWVMTGCIWLFTLPLTLWHFHLASPVGLLVNVVLIPFTTVMLGLGYAMLVLGLAHPALAILPAVGFEWVLAGLLWVVRASAATPLGHIWTPAPPGVWLAGYYLLLAVATGLTPLWQRTMRVWQVTGLWTAAGLACGLWPAPSDGLRATFLAVGHGCAVLIETPSGRTLLYDAGSFADGRKAQQTVQGALWAYERHRLDAAIVSHADVDHFNGLPGLCATVPIGTLCCSPTMLDFAQSPVAELCEAAAVNGVPLRLLQAGDRLHVDPDVSIEVLHPPGGLHARTDNANSVVLRMEYAGRSLLLTGDVEADGLERLLSLPSRPVDILQSPHHGSLSANPKALADWARPRWVITSAGDADADPALCERYGAQATLLNTAEHGAICVRISSQGNLDVTPFVAPDVTDERRTRLVQRGYDP